MREGARDAVADAMVVKLIENFGLSFRPTADQISALRNAHTPLTILTAVETAHMPAPPTPKTKDGALSVTCAPVDCDIAANDRLVGRTSGGVLPWITLPPGRVVVTAASRNYEAVDSRREVVLQPGERTYLAFRFEPSPAYRSEVGAQLYRQMLEALGTSESKPPETIRASGTLYIRDDSGAVSPWSIVAWIRGQDIIRMEVSRLQERYELIGSGSGFSWKKRPRKKDAGQLQEAAAALAGSLLPRRIEPLKGEGMRIAANDSANEPTARFRAQGAEAAYTVTLDSSSRPSRIQREHEAGARDATFLYSDYVEEDGILYPRAIHVLFDGSQWGIEARFSSVRRATD